MVYDLQEELAKNIHIEIFGSILMMWKLSRMIVSEKLLLNTDFSWYIGNKKIKGKLRK